MLFVITVKISVIPISQKFPVNSGEQIQEKCSPPSALQEPPFWQGFCEQGPKCNINIF